MDDEREWENSVFSTWLDDDDDDDDDDDKIQQNHTELINNISVFLFKMNSSD